MKKRILALAVLMTLCLSFAPKTSAALFTDVPDSSWAKSDIEEAAGMGVIGGYGDGTFGYGKTVTRAEFAAMLVRLFKWTAVTPDAPSFQDNTDKTKWYYSVVETAVNNGAVTTDSTDFRPNDFITREEMAVMLVRSLGYGAMADSLKVTETPFADVTGDLAYIQMAYDFGIINGMTATSFGPSQSATREQAAAMMMRLYGKISAKTDWLHAFYAISSYSQKDVIGELNAVSFGWSRMDYTGGRPALNMTAAGGNPYFVPDGSSEVVALAQNKGAADNLSVYMDATSKITLPDGTSSTLGAAALLTADGRAETVGQIVAALEGDAAYSGVTIDFEQMKGTELRDGFTAFLTQLKAETDKLGKKLYVCVLPVTADGVYYDAYDYRAIGNLADKVILMAHDYAALTLTPSEQSAGFTATPVSPIGEIYTALKAVTDSTTGVADKSKIALAVSMTSVQWKVKNGAVVNAEAYQPLPPAIYSRLTDAGTTMNFSKKYMDPYITYHTDSDGTDNIIWYEDARSVEAKVEMARLFGVTGVSVWRLGIIPDDQDAGGKPIYYDVLGWLLAQK